MTVVTKTQQFVLWRECYRILKETKGVWGYWVLGLSFVQALLSYLVQKDVEGKIPTQAQIEQMTAEEKRQMMSTLFTPDFFIGIVEAGLLFFLVQIAAVYVYTVVYLRRAAPNSHASLSLNGFFFWLKRGVVQYLAPILPVSLFLAAVSILMPSGGLSAAMGVFLLFSSLIILCAGLYVFFRLQLVAPLSVFRREPVLKNSWEMTRGKVGYIWWNLFVLGLRTMITVFFYMLLPLLFVGILSLNAEDAFYVMIGREFVSNIFSNVGLVGACILSCEFYRIVLKQKKEAASALQRRDVFDPEKTR